jgi:hypothetical protein
MQCSVSRELFGDELREDRELAAVGSECLHPTIVFERDHDGVVRVEGRGSGVLVMVRMG